MNRLRLNPLDWPITMKVPLLVVCLMLAVSTVLSERVLDRLTQMQENELKSLASTYLNSLASSLQPHVLREDVWEVYDTLDRMRSDAAGFRPLRSVVVNPGLVVLASSDPRWAPVKSKLPEDLLSVSESRTDLLIDPIANRAFAQREISYQDRKIGTVFAEIDIAPLLIERTNVFQTLLLTNALLTLAFAIVGYLAVRRMLRPVKVLTEHIDRGRQGSVEQIVCCQRLMNRLLGVHRGGFWLIVTLESEDETQIRTTRHSLRQTCQRHPPGDAQALFG